MGKKKLRCPVCGFQRLVDKKEIQDEYQKQLNEIKQFLLKIKYH